jgi:hypothetical protein
MLRGTQGREALRRHCLRVGALRRRRRFVGQGDEEDAEPASVSSLCSGTLLADRLLAPADELQRAEESRGERASS